MPNHECRGLTICYLLLGWRRDIITLMPAKGDSKYTPEKGERIAALVALNKTFFAIGKDIGVDDTTIVNWLLKEPDLLEKLAPVRITQAESIVNELLEVNEQVRAGLLAPDVARVMLQSLQWLAKVRNPKVYGDKTILSNDPENPVTSLALRLDTAIAKRKEPIDVTPQRIIEYQPLIDDGSDLI